MDTYLYFIQESIGFLHWLLQNKLTTALVNLTRTYNEKKLAVENLFANPSHTILIAIASYTLVTSYTFIHIQSSKV